MISCDRLDLSEDTMSDPRVLVRLEAMERAMAEIQSELAKFRFDLAVLMAELELRLAVHESRHTE
jgi:hypothetical protein